MGKPAPTNTYLHTYTAFRGPICTTVLLQYLRMRNKYGMSGPLCIPEPMEFWNGSWDLLASCSAVDPFQAQD
jgi:hypothetical protein